MGKDTTKFGAIEREFAAWRKGFMKNPWRTALIGLLIVILIGLGSIAPRAFNDLYSWILPSPTENPFSETQIIYSNYVPIESDKLDLDRSGSLIPAPNNFIAPFYASPEGQCIVPSEETLPYSQGIVLIRNTPTIFGEKITTFIPPSESDYFIFHLGDSHEVTTGGRAFQVTLSHMNDLTTEENAPYGGYFSYTFDIREK